MAKKLHRIPDTADFYDVADVLNKMKPILDEARFAKKYMATVSGATVFIMRKATKSEMECAVNGYVPVDMLQFDRACVRIEKIILQSK